MWYLASTVGETTFREVGARVSVLDEFGRAEKLFADRQTVETALEYGGRIARQDGGLPVLPALGLPFGDDLPRRVEFDLREEALDSLPFPVATPRVGCLFVPAGADGARMSFNAKVDPASDAARDEMEHAMEQARVTFGQPQASHPR